MAMMGKRLGLARKLKLKRARAQRSTTGRPPGSVAAPDTRFLRGAGIELGAGVAPRLNPTTGLQMYKPGVLRSGITNAQA